MEGDARQFQCHDTLPALAARDADPVAEGCAGGPVAMDDAERV